MTVQSAGNRFVAVGDVMLGDSAICVGFGFHSRHPADASPAFANVAPLLRSGDVVLGNLECLLTGAGRGVSRLGADQMRGDPEYAQSLRAAGFTAMSVANNHAMQHGSPAFEQTVDNLRNVGIAPVGLRGEDGWTSAPVVQSTRSGLKIGLLGYSWRPRQYDAATPPYATGDVDAVEKDVRRLSTRADAVVVSLHWGEEFLGSPSESEVAAARRIVDAGALVIVGHHPHVLRPVERYASGVICYSLGNLVTDMVWQPALRHGAVFACGLDAGRVVEPLMWRTYVDDSYAAVVESRGVQPDGGSVQGITESDYRKLVNRSVRLQQLAAYRYALRNVFRYAPGVLAEMIMTTAVNKFSGLLAPRRRARPAGN
jgi:poly-gamma-glutamate synthesis protein (capsule biosynthesis protein)